MITARELNTEKNMSKTKSKGKSKGKSKEEVRMLIDSEEEDPLGLGTDTSEKVPFYLLSGNVMIDANGKSMKINNLKNPPKLRRFSGRQVSSKDSNANSNEEHKYHAAYFEKGGGRRAFIDRSVVDRKPASVVNPGTDIHRHPKNNNTNEDIHGTFNVNMTAEFFRFGRSRSGHFNEVAKAINGHADNAFIRMDRFNGNPNTEREVIGLDQPISDGDLTEYTQQVQEFYNITGDLNTEEMSAYSQLLSSDDMASTAGKMLDIKPDIEGLTDTTSSSSSSSSSSSPKSSSPVDDNMEVEGKLNKRRQHLQSEHGKRVTFDEVHENRRKYINTYTDYFEETLGPDVRDQYASAETGFDVTRINIQERDHAEKMIAHTGAYVLGVAQEASRGDIHKMGVMFAANANFKKLLEPKFVSVNPLTGEFEDNELNPDKSNPRKHAGYSCPQLTLAEVEELLSATDDPDKMCVNGENCACNKWWGKPCISVQLNGQEEDAIQIVDRKHRFCFICMNLYMATRVFAFQFVRRMLQQAPAEVMMDKIEELSYMDEEDMDIDDLTDIKQGVMERTLIQARQHHYCCVPFGVPGGLHPRCGIKTMHTIRLVTWIVSVNKHMFNIKRHANGGWSAKFKDGVKYQGPPVPPEQDF